MTEPRIFKLINNWDEISNRELFKTKIEISKDEDIAIKMKSIIAQYQFKEKVVCGISTCCTKHNNGYLVNLNDGSEIIIGNVCGKRYFGVTFTNHKKIMNNLRVEYENSIQLAEIYANLIEMKQKFQEIVCPANRNSYYILNMEIQKLQKPNNDISYWMIDMIKKRLGANGEIYEIIKKTEDEIEIEKEMKRFSSKSENNYVAATKLIEIDRVENFEVIYNWYKNQELFQYFENIHKNIKDPNSIGSAKEIKKIIQLYRGYDNKLVEFNDFCIKADLLLKKNNLLKLCKIFNDQNHINSLSNWANKF